MIRASMRVIRAIHKYKEEFPVLFAEYNKIKKGTRKEKSPLRNKVKDSWLSVSEEAEAEYLELVTKHLVVSKVPNSNREVLIETHTGGKHVGFYEDGAWWYNNLHKGKLAEKSLVIHWGEN